MAFWGKKRGVFEEMDRHSPVFVLNLSLARVVGTTGCPRLCYNRDKSRRRRA